MKGYTSRMSRGSPGGRDGKDVLGRRNKDMEAGKRANDSGNSQKVLHCYIQQICGHRLGDRMWARGESQQTWNAGLKHFDTILKATDPFICSCGF